MEKIFIKTRCKINLTLDILNKREDGYHNLQSIMQCIHLYDELYIQKQEHNEIILDCNVEELNNTNNIAYKACKLMKEKYNIETGINVKLIKHIPTEAGLRRR